MGISIGLHARHVYAFSASTALTPVSVFTARIHKSAAPYGSGEANIIYPPYLINADWEKDAATNKPTTCE